MQTEFNIAADTLYLNHAAVSPWPQRSCDAVCRFAEENARQGARAYPAWMKVEQGLRERLARLIHAPSVDDIALVKNTSEALSFVAQGLSWRAGDNVVGIAQEFPSNRITWQALARRGVEFRALDLYQSANPEADLLALCDSNTRLLSVSSVQYARGLRLNLEQLGESCRKKNILFCVDAIQHIGALNFDVEAAQADFVAADGHKWMLGPEGLALFYIRADARDKLELTQHGWHMVQQLGDYDRPDWRPAASARRFECGSPNMLGIHALDASLSLIEQTGLRPIYQAISRKIQLIYDAIEQSGFTLLSPAAPERRSGIATFAIPHADHEAVYRELMQQGVVCALRGGGLRFSPHFYTEDASIEKAFDILRSVLARTANR
jgi:selenocysteine lyase/cysteine desulfurase